MQQWEYIELALDGTIDRDWYWTDTHQSSNIVPVGKRLSDMGRAGWELVSVSVQNLNGNSQYFYYIFKRPIP